MNPLGKHLPKLLTALSCTALLATAPAAVAAPVTHHKAHAVRTRHAHVSCTARSARSVRARRRAHAALRSCHITTHHTARTRVHPHKASNKTPVSNGSTTVVNPQAASAQIAAVLATPCQNTEVTPAAGNLPLVRAAVLCLINQERAQNGRSPLTANPELEQAAEGHCAELVADDYFAHVSPGGETPVQRIQATGYIPGPSVGYAIGENLAWGTLSLSTPRAIVAAWIASPGHLANILEGQYTETGVGVSSAVPSSLGEGQPGATYAQEFGVIIH